MQDSHQLQVAVMAACTCRYKKLCGCRSLVVAAINAVVATCNACMGWCGGTRARCHIPLFTAVMGAGLETVWDETGLAWV